MLGVVLPDSEDITTTDGRKDSNGVCRNWVPSRRDVLLADFNYLIKIADRRSRRERKRLDGSISKVQMADARSTAAALDKGDVVGQRLAHGWY